MLNRMESDGEERAARRALDTVLIVEDDVLLSLMMEDLVRDEGARNIQVCRESDEALHIAREQALDCAILDVSIRNGSTYEVADALAARNIPFLFCTGLSAGDIEERHRHRPLLAKPYGDTQFKECFAQALAG